MASENVIEFTDSNFDETALQADQPVLVDFWAEWCGPCRILAPTIDQLADEFEGRARIGKMDTDSNQQTAAKYGVSAIPTVILLKGGEVQKKFVGLQSKEDLASAIEAIG